MVSRAFSSAAQLSSAFSKGLPAQLSTLFSQLSSLSSGKSLCQLSSAIFFKICNSDAENRIKMLRRFNSRDFRRHGREPRMKFIVIFPWANLVQNKRNCSIIIAQLSRIKQSQIVSCLSLQFQIAISFFSFYLNLSLYFLYSKLFVFEAFWEN